MVDDVLPETAKLLGGRTSTLSDSEVVTVLAFNVLTFQLQTLRYIYSWAQQSH